MTETNDKLRALVLAALMVLSVFAGTIALSGSAAANHGPSGDSADEHLASQGTFWQGQELWFDANGAQDDDEVQVRRVDSDGGIGGLVSEIVVDTTAGADDNGTIDTSDLDGDYILVNESNVLNVEDGVVQLDGETRTAVNAGENASQFSFEVAVQTISAEFDDDTLPAREGETATIDLSSNRGSYTVNVSAEGLDEDDLADIFNQVEDGNDVINASAGEYDSTSDEDEDSSIQINATSSSSIVANFSSYEEAGSYTFDFEVSDTTASASASVDVESKDVDLSFTQSVYSDQVGDATTFVISLEDTTEAYLWVGGDSVNYLERVHLVDDDEDGLIIVTMNTWKAGREGYTDKRPNNASQEGEGYLIPSDFDDEFGSDGITRYNTSTAPLSGGNPSISAGNLSTPVDTGSYDLTLSSSDEPPRLSNDNSDIVIEDEEDVATLELSERSTDGIRTLVAPTGDVDIDPDDEDDVNELLASATPADTVTLGDNTGDILLVQVNASGTTGYVSDDGTTVAGISFPGVALIDGAGDSTIDGSSVGGVYFNITREGPNQGDVRIDLDSPSDAIQLINFASPAETFYVALDMRSVQVEPSGDVADGQTWEVSFQVGNEDHDSSPNFYVDDGEHERVETTVTFQDPDAEFDNIADGDLQVEQDSNATVSGSSNVAPGEELTVRLRKTGDSPFLRTQTVTAGANGAWEATFDTSDLPVDTEFTATVREGSTTISDEVDAVIVEQATPTPTTEPPETTTEPPETTTEPPETTTAPPETTTEPPETTESPGQPGFGVAIAIVALLGAALLALRRRD